MNEKSVRSSPSLSAMKCKINAIRWMFSWLVSPALTMMQNISSVGTFFTLIVNK